MMRALGLWRQQQKQLLQGYATNVSASSQLSFHATCGPTQHVVPHRRDIRVDAARHPNHTSGSATGRCTRQYATSAEFSGGAFIDTGESSSQDVHDQEPEDKQMLLEAALVFVKERGWTRATLVAGAQHIGMSPALIGLLPRGSAELVEYHNEKCNSDLAQLLQNSQASWQQMRTMQRVREGVKLRLEMNIPYIDTWAQALSIQSQPRNVPTALQQLAQVTDDIWHAAGDKATDYNWYTKRGLLASVYTATELYMLTDYSPGYADTWDVLDRRLEDVVKLGKFVGQTKKTVASMFEQISSSFLDKHRSTGSYPK